MESVWREGLEDLWLAVSQFLREFGLVQDRLDPGRLPEYQRRLRPAAHALRQALEAPGVAPLLKSDPAGQILSRAASQAVQAAARFEAATGPQQMLKAFQALRPAARAEEILYELVRDDRVSRFFLNPAREQDEALVSSLREPSAQSAPRGIIHVDHERGRRGGYSLYVPENYTSERKWPLVVALHGGSGHGADFLWSWLRDARSSGFLLASPTSLERTWSIRNVGMDAAGLNRMLGAISEAYCVDLNRILLTGISDGGTYAMLLSIVRQSPFTHFAPVAAAVHVLLNRDGIIDAPVQGLRIYHVHGRRDWMFPVEHARLTAAALEKAGARITYREIEDLSHNYPRDENERMIRWFLG